MIKTLLTLANQLDKKGFYQLADSVDSIIKLAAETDYYGYSKQDLEKQPVMDIGDTGMTKEQYKRYYGKDRPIKDIFDFFDLPPSNPSKVKSNLWSGEWHQEGYNFTEFLDWLIDLEQNLKKIGIKIIHISRVGGGVGKDIWIQTNLPINVIGKTIWINKDKSIVVKISDTFGEDMPGILLTTEPEAREFIFDLAKNLIKP